MKIVVVDAGNSSAFLSMFSFAVQAADIVRQKTGVKIELCRATLGQEVAVSRHDFVLLTQPAVQQALAHNGGLSSYIRAGARVIALHDNKFASRGAARALVGNVPHAAALSRLHALAVICDVCNKNAQRRRVDIARNESFLKVTTFMPHTH